MHIFIRYNDQRQMSKLRSVMNSAETILSLNVCAFVLYIVEQDSSEVRSHYGQYFDKLGLNILPFYLTVSKPCEIMFRFEYDCFLYSQCTVLIIIFSGYEWYEYLCAFMYLTVRKVTIQELNILTIRSDALSFLFILVIANFQLIVYFQMEKVVSIAMYQLTAVWLVVYSCVCDHTSLLQ